MTKAIAIIKIWDERGGILDLISNSVESEDGEEVFWNPFPLLCVPVSQCLSVPVSYLFCWVARLARVQVKPGGKQIWKGIKIRPWFLKKTHQISILFAVIVGHWDNDHLCRGEEPRYPVEVLDRFLMIEQVSPRTRLPPQFTNAMTRPRPGNWPTLNIILGFRETRSELGNWGAAARPQTKAHEGSKKRQRQSISN